VRTPLSHGEMGNRRRAEVIREQVGEPSRLNPKIDLDQTLSNGKTDQIHLRAGPEFAG
jgi:hypothetical protein